MSSSQISSGDDDEMYDYSENDDYFEGNSEYGASEEYIIAETGTVSPVNSLRRASYRVLGREDLAKRQAEVVDQSSELLCVDASQAVRVLRYYKW